MKTCHTLSHAGVALKRVVSLSGNLSVGFSPVVPLYSVLYGIRDTLDFLALPAKYVEQGL